MRHKKRQVPENHDRWLVSYADFITLLFAFFVVMFASTKTDKSHARAVSESIEKALRSGTASENLSALMNGIDGKKGLKVADQINSNNSKVKVQQPLHPGTSEDLSSSLDILKRSLDQEVSTGTVRLSLEQRGLIVELNAGAFFAKGDDAINASAYPILERLSAVLNNLPNSLRLEGHTDSLPISNSRFQSNWELSAARSIAMLRVLDEKYAVARKRMAIVGYGDTVELASNETEEGRTRNRRVDIVILNEQGMKSEPAQTGKLGPSPQTANNLLLHNSEPIASTSQQLVNKP